MLRELKEYGAASIVEVIVTSVIFVVAAAGILSTVAMFRPQGTDASRKIEAAYIGKGILDDLRQQINAENWNDTGASYFLEPGQSYTVTVGDYNVIYNVTEAAGGEFRFVEMSITYPDAE